MNKSIILISFLLIFFSSFAQWNPTTGPGGGTTNQFFASDGNLFMATGEFGAGAIFLSEDEGISWTLKNKGLPLNTVVHSVFGDNTYLYAGTGLYGVFRSADFGETWTEANNGMSDFGMRILTLYENGGTVYAGTQEGAYLSTDHGDTWDLKNNGLEGAAKRVAAFTELNSVLFIATPLGVYKSENAGDNWVLSSNGIPADKVYSFDIATKGNLLFVVALDGIYRSSDFGLSWSMVGNEHFTGGLFTIEAFEEYIYAGSNGKMYQSADDGDSWEEIGSGLPSSQYIYAIYADENTLLCGTNFRGNFLYKQESDEWIQSNEGFSNENVVTMMTDGNNLFAGTLRADFGQIFKTADNGNVWMLSDNGADEVGFRCLLNTGSHFLAGSDGSYIFRSSDQGLNWEHISYPDFPASYVSDFCYLNGIAFASSIGFNIDVYSSEDDGASWTACEVPGAGDIYGLLSKGNFVYAGRTDGVYRSADLGVSWIKTSGGMPENPFIKKFTATDDFIFASSIGGLYRSDDNGENWELIFSPSFNQRIESLASHDEYLFAGTMETGLLYSIDNGETWEASNPEFFADPEGIFPTVFAIEIKGDSMYVAYQDYSIWVRPVPDVTGIGIHKQLQEQKLINNMSVYPNPIYGNSNLTFSLLNDEIVKCSLIDLMGHQKKELYEGYQSSGVVQISIQSAGLEPGVYFIVVQAGNDPGYHKIIIAE